MTLPAFEGVPVVRSTVRITRAGDGLSEALKLDPVALHHADEVLFVLRGVVSQVNHKPDGSESDVLVRVHTVEAVEIAMVGDGTTDALEEILREDRERVEKAKREAEGVLTFDDGLQSAHDAGEHAELVEGCADCDAERDAVAAEAAEKKSAKK